MKKDVSKTGKILEYLMALFLILLGTILRLLPHPPNLAPVTTIALFAGVYLSPKMAFILPILAMLISDYFLGFYQFSLMAFVYLSFLFTVFLGIYLKKKKKWYTILGGSLCASILFFILTNFAVWAFTPWYQKSFTGFVECYTMAIPFFRNTLAGDLFYVALFFGAFKLVKVLIAKKFQIPEKIIISKK